MMSAFPQEHLVELKGLSPFLVGRIVIHKNGALYDAEIDIIQSESGKIYNHVEIVYGQFDPREALDLGVHHLRNYLIKKTK
jgi:hypothetical protein